MPRLPRITGKEMVRALEPMGFVIVRVKGSHHVLMHPDGRRMVVPVHAGEIIGPKLLGKMLREGNVSADDLVNAL